VLLSLNISAEHKRFLTIHGIYTQASGMRFPERVKGFQRVEINESDGEARHAGICYQFPEGATPTVFVFIEEQRAPLSWYVNNTEASFRRDRKSSGVRVSDIRLVQAGAVFSGRAVEGMAEHHYSNGWGQTKQFQYLFANRGWIIKYNCATSVLIESDVRIDVQKLLEALRMPTKS